MHQIAAIAALQHGRVSRSQLLACGISPTVIRRLVRDGILHRERPGVYAFGNPAQTPESKRWCALLAFRHATLTHGSGSALWVVGEETDGRVELSVPGGSGRPRNDGLIVHRAQLRTDEVGTIGDMPVTSLERTLLDLAATRSTAEAGRALEQARVEHQLQPSALRAYLETRPGERGTAQLRRLLDGKADAGLLRSIFEARVFDLCVAAGMEKPLTNWRIDRWEVDFAWPARRLVLECQSRKWHSTERAKLRDEVKALHLGALGWRVETTWWTEVHRQPRALLARLLG